MVYLEFETEIWRCPPWLGNGEKFSLLGCKKCHFKLQFKWICRKIQWNLLKIRTNRKKCLKISKSRTFFPNFSKSSKISKSRTSGRPEIGERINLKSRTKDLQQNELFVIKILCNIHNAISVAKKSDLMIALSTHKND